MLPAGITYVAFIFFLLYGVVVSSPLVLPPPPPSLSLARLQSTPNGDRCTRRRKDVRDIIVVSIRVRVSTYSERI